jgi:hypothetical protein
MQTIDDLSDNDAAVADIGAGNRKGFLCVERLDAVDRAVSLAPGGWYHSTMVLSRD